MAKEDCLSPDFVKGGVKGSQWGGEKGDHFQHC